MKLSILTIAALLVSMRSVSAGKTDQAPLLECHLGKPWDVLKQIGEGKKGTDTNLPQIHFSEAQINANLQDPDCVAKMDPSIIEEGDKNTDFLDTMVAANTLSNVPSNYVQNFHKRPKVCEHIFTKAAAVMPAIGLDRVHDLPPQCIFDDKSKHILEHMSLEQIDKLNDAVLKSPLRYELLKDSRFASRLNTGKLKMIVGEGFEGCGKLNAEDLLHFPKDVLNDLPSNCVSEIKKWKKKGGSSTLDEIDYRTLAGNLNDSAFELWTSEFETAESEAILKYLRDVQIKNLDAKTLVFRCSFVALASLPPYMAKHIAPECAAGYFGTLAKSTEIPSRFFTYAPDDLFSKVENVEFLAKLTKATDDVHPLSTFHAAHWEDLLKKDLETTCTAITSEAAGDVLSTFPPNTDPQCFAYMKKDALPVVLATIINVLPDNALSKLTAGNTLDSTVLEKIADAKASLLLALGAEFSGPGNFCAQYKLDNIKTSLVKSIPHLHKNCILSIDGIDNLKLESIGDYPEAVQKAVGLDTMVADLDVDYFKNLSVSQWLSVFKHPSICAALSFPQFSAIDEKFISSKALTAVCLGAFTFASQLSSKQISLILPETLSTVDAKFFEKIDITALTEKQLESLGPNAVGLGPSAPAKLTASKLAVLKSTALGSLPPAAFNYFTEDKWKVIKPPNLTLIDRERFGKLPEPVILVTTKPQAEMLGKSITDEAKKPAVSKAVHALLQPDVQKLIKVIDEPAAVPPAAAATA